MISLGCGKGSKLTSEIQSEEREMLNPKSTILENVKPLTTQMH